MCVYIYICIYSCTYMSSTGRVDVSRESPFVSGHEAHLSVDPSGPGIRCTKQTRAVFHVALDNRNTIINGLT